ncbi:MAG: AI-2E family transporter [Gemmatimonadales bacterium]
MTLPPTPRAPATRASTLLLAGIFLILVTAALRFGAGFLFPLALAVLFTLLLDPAVRALKRVGLPSGIGAALVVFGAVGAIAGGVVLLSGPAMEWIGTAPEKLSKAQVKIRRILLPIQRTAEQVDRATTTTAPGDPEKVEIKSAGFLQRASVSTRNLVGTMLAVVFLTYFLLATLPDIRRRLAVLIGTRTGVESVEDVLAEIETQMSRYVALNTLTSLGVGLATWGFLTLMDLPNPLLWGVVSGLLNFIPFIGAFVAVGLIGLSALLAFDGVGTALLIVAGCVAINALEGNLVTPMLMGRHLPLNPVTIFVGLLYWGWVWGPAGMLLAVPLTVMIHVVCTRITPLQPVATLMGNS